MDTDNLIEIFNKDYEHVESVRTSARFSKKVITLRSFDIVSSASSVDVIENRKYKIQNSPYGGNGPEIRIPVVHFGIPAKSRVLCKIENQNKFMDMPSTYFKFPITHFWLVNLLLVDFRVKNHPSFKKSGLMNHPIRFL